MRYFAVALITTLLAASHPAQASTSYSLSHSFDPETEDEMSLGECERVVTIPKDTPEYCAMAFYEMGRGFAEQSRYPEAIEAYSKVIDILPEFTSAYSERSKLFVKSKQPKKALADANRAISLQPTQAGLYGVRAEAYEALGKKREALADYEKALKLNATLTVARDAIKRLRSSK